LKLASIIVAGFTALALYGTVAVANAAPTQDVCTEQFARLSGRLAYLEVKLDLTAEQHPLWDTWRAAVADGAGKVRAVCLQRVPNPDGRPTIIERLAHIQERLATGAAALQAAQPSLAALYQSLTPEQREMFEHGMRMEHGRHHRHDRDHDRHGMGVGHGDGGHEGDHAHE
jgi:hypothetical protein